MSEHEGLRPGHKQNLGAVGEQAAEHYLGEHGFVILERNVRTKYGEIDIIGMDGSELVFIEVKARTNTAYGFPEESINPGKRQHMIDSAQDYLCEHEEIDCDWRMDVIAIQYSKGNSKPVIRHFENVQ
jgi:putative endonuclease